MSDFNFKDELSIQQINEYLYCEDPPIQEISPKAYNLFIQYLQNLYEGLKGIENEKDIILKLKSQLNPKNKYDFRYSIFEDDKCVDNRFDIPCLKKLFPLYRKIFNHIIYCILNDCDEDLMMFDFNPEDEDLNEVFYVEADTIVEKWEKFAFKI